MRGINQRELGRKERATAECERQIRRSSVQSRKCVSPVVFYKLSPEQVKQVLAGRKTVDDFIKEGQ